MEYRFGTSGWSYEKWVGPFYPGNIRSANFLKLYSKVFNAVEVDSSFYGSAQDEAVISWKNSTPGDFKFTAKLPRNITHELKLRNVERELDGFIQTITLLGTKLGCILVQLPPFLKYNEGSERLLPFLELLPDDMRFAIEFRDNSWFRKEVFDALRKYGASIVWSEIPVAEVPKILTSDLIYLRLIGDRSIPEDKFGTILVDRSEILKKWANSVRERGDAEMAYIFSNNHFEGFAPGTINRFRRMLGLDEIGWVERMRGGLDDSQRTLL